LTHLGRAPTEPEMLYARVAAPMIAMPSFVRRCLSIRSFGVATAQPSVLVTDGLSPSAITLLSERANVIQHHYSSDELDSGALTEYDGVIIRSATSLSAKALRAGANGRLRAVGRAGVGVDNIDLEGARDAKLWVLNTPGASTSSVVELALAHMLGAARGLQVSDAGLKNGGWLKGNVRDVPNNGQTQGHELSGKRLGLLGFGRIGRGVGRVTSALGMHVHAYSPRADPVVAAKIGVTLLPSVSEIFATCTHVVVLCAMGNETRGLVSRSYLEMMPHVAPDGTPCGAHLFNLARGGIVVESDVAVALRDGTLSTYGTDVFEQEPLPPDSPLLSCDNFSGTPHNGAATLEASSRVGTIIASNMLDALGGKKPADGVVLAM